MNYYIACMVAISGTGGLSLGFSMFFLGCSWPSRLGRVDGSTWDEETWETVSVEPPVLQLYEVLTRLYYVLSVHRDAL